MTFLFFSQIKNTIQMSADKRDPTGADILDKPNIGQSVSTEITGKAEMEPCQKCIPDISTQILTAQYDHNRIFCEKSQNIFCRHFCHKPDQNAVYTCYQHCRIQSLCCSVMLVCTNILRRKCRYRCQHGRRYDKCRADKFLNNTDRCRWI